VAELEKALNLPDEDFAETYGREKPAIDAVLIFSCKAGGRAARAANLANTLGFTKYIKLYIQFIFCTFIFLYILSAKAYAGSWTEWQAKQS